MTKGTKKIFRLLAAIVFIVCVCAFGLAFWLARHYRGIIKEKLPGWVTKSTDSLYHVDFRKISINFFTQSITFHDVHLWYDSNRIARLNELAIAPPNYYNIRVPELTIKGIAWRDLQDSKNIRCGELKVSNPNLRIIHISGLADSLLNKHERKESAIDKLTISDLFIKDAIVNYRNLLPDGQSFNYINGLNVHLMNWQLQPNQPRDTTHFAFAESGTVRFKYLLHRKQDRLYRIRMHDFYFNSLNDSCSVHNFEIGTVVNTDDFYKIVGHQKDLFYFNFPLVTCSGLAWKKLMHKQGFSAKNIWLTDATVSDYFSRLPAPNPESKLGKFPQQLLQKIKLPIDIQQIFLNNASVKYSELNTRTKKAGIITFTKIHGDIKNITNKPDLLSRDNHCFVRMKGKFMNRADITTTFNFILDDTTGGFSVNGNLNNLDAEAINEPAQALALAEVRSLHLSRMDMMIQGNEHFARGNFTILYDKLRLKFQKIKKDSSGIKRMGFISFIANNIFMYSDNPAPNEPIRTVTSYAVRNEHTSFFNLIWSNVFTGVLKTVMRSEDIANRLQQRALGKQREKKKGFFKGLFRKKEKDSTRLPSPTNIN